MVRRKNFTSESLQAADIFGNVSVAWFSIGVIAPLFGDFESLEFLLRLMGALVMAGVFFFVSLELARRGQK
jgi:hypothetical protein